MDTAASLMRGPLVEKANSPPPTLQRVRRKSSFIRRMDSSEESPSPHESIFEAYHLSASDDWSIRIEQAIPMVPLSKTETRLRNDENERAIRDAEFRYGRGTVLDTITEKHSNGTMRSVTRSRSADNVHNFPFLGHRDSFVVAKSPRRKHSFSVDDVQLIKQSYHAVCHEIYDSPKMPLQEPVERPGTPPGMPSWTAAQRAPTAHMQRGPRHVPGTPNRIQRFFGIESSGITFSSRFPHPDDVRVVSAPATRSTAQRVPIFRPPQSAYGPISRHPFNSAPMAFASVSQTGSPMRKVRFTPSATARDSAEIDLRNAEVNLRSAMASTVASASHPMSLSLPTLPVAPLSSASIEHRTCLHRTKKHSASPMVENSIKVQNSINIQVVRSNSGSSVAPLMSGARSPGPFSGHRVSMSPMIEGGVEGTNLGLAENAIRDGESSRRSLPCMRCIWEKWAERAGQFWASTSSCLCFVCCGYECDDDESTVYGGYPYGTGIGYFEHSMESRREITEQMPASMV